MSIGNIDFLLGLWAASLAPHDDNPPFFRATHMFKTIDETPLGEAPWQSFTVYFDGDRPAGNVPSWMEAGYDVWFRDPRVLVHNLLSNPDFKGEMDLVPFQERSPDGAHRFQNFMSGLWAWNQAVSLFR
jgi:hypothetical protein